MHTPEQVQDEIARLLRQLADPVEAGESVKALIRRASTRAGIPYGQAKRAWYKEWRTIPAHVADGIRERAEAHERRLRKAAYQAVVAMQESDPEYFRECIEELGDILLPLGGQSGSSGTKD